MSAHPALPRLTLCLALTAGLPTFATAANLPVSSTSASANTTSASTVPANTVLDYYLTLPQKYLAALGTTKNRADLIKIRDIQNGYLELSGSWEGNAQLALWTGSGGRQLLGVVQTDCGPACHQTMYFLERQNGQWIDVTRKAFTPLGAATLLGYYDRVRQSGDEDFRKSGDAPFLYNLPRSGTSVQVIVDPSFADRPTVLTTFRFDPKTMSFTDQGGVKR